MSGLPQSLLINILGHAAGALIFAIFLCLLFSGRGWSGGRGRYLPGLAAALSLAWNAGSLVVLAWPGMPASAGGLVAALSFSALSLLPAVLLHVSLEDRQKPLVICGYILSAVAVAMHFREAYANGAALHQRALLLITVGFLILTAAGVGVSAFRHDPARRPSGARLAASMCLALFASSFVHFGAAHAHEAWSGELIVHHAGIPLALFVLLQDYRFVLLDAFVRFLANVLLAAVLTGAVIEGAFRLHLAADTAREPLAEALLLIGTCLFLVTFAWLRNRVQLVLTHAVFRQGALANLAERVKESAPFATEQQYLDWAAQMMADAVRTTRFAVVPQAEAAARPDWVEATVPVRLGANSLVILLGSRSGGQRYLREDLDSLIRAAAEVAERVESLRREELNRLVSQAELRALQSQINPHFLFNALNTLYGSIPREAAGARRMVLNLADIFRYFLQTDKTLVPLSQEMQIVRAYLEVEQIRLGSRLNVEIEFDARAADILIPVLSIQPLVENAIKHGIAPCADPGYVRIRMGLSSTAVEIVVENSAGPSGASAPGAGVGLENVRRRLEICYGESAALDFATYPDRVVVTLRIPLEAGALVAAS